MGRVSGQAPGTVGAEGLAWRLYGEGFMQPTVATGRTRGVIGRHGRFPRTRLGARALPPYGGDPREAVPRSPCGRSVRGYVHGASVAGDVGCGPSHLVPRRPFAQGGGRFLRGLLGSARYRDGGGRVHPHGVRLRFPGRRTRGPGSRRGGPRSGRRPGRAGRRYVEQPDPNPHQPWIARLLGNALEPRLRPLRAGGGRRRPGWRPGCDGRVGRAAEFDLQRLLAGRNPIATQ